MDLTVSEAIKVIAKRKGMTLKDVATATNQTRQNLCNKMGADDFRESEIRDIAAVLGCSVTIRFVDNQTGEEY